MNDDCEPGEFFFPQDESKPGRALAQIDGEAIEQEMSVRWDDFRWPYIVTMDRGVVAGNHYHDYKREVIQVVYGAAFIGVEDPSTRRFWGFHVNSTGADGLPQAIAIPRGFAHAVRADSDQVVLYVHSTDRARDPEDDFDYQVLPRPTSEPA